VVSLASVQGVIKFTAAAADVPLYAVQNGKA